MRLVLTPMILLFAAVAWLAPSAGAAQDIAGVRAEVLADLEVTAGKYMELARSLSAEHYDWSPAPGVRTAGQVFLHIAGNNYFLPITIGQPAPTDVPINDSYQSVVAFEQTGTRDAIIESLERSFAHLERALRHTEDSDLEREVPFFGRRTSVRGVWIQTATHLHEHLGQLIVYARANGVVPPWSR